MRKLREQLRYVSLYQTEGYFSLFELSVYLDAVVEGCCRDSAILITDVIQYFYVLIQQPLSKLTIIQGQSSP